MPGELIPEILKIPGIAKVSVYWGPAARMKTGKSTNLIKDAKTARLGMLQLLFIRKTYIASHVPVGCSRDKKEINLICHH